MKHCLTALLAMMAFSGYASDDAVPVHRWNFDRLGWFSRLAEDLGSGKPAREMRGRIATGQGVFGSDALRADVANGGEVLRFPLAFDEWTIDCSFRIDIPNSAGNRRPIFRYATDSERFIETVLDGNRIAVRAPGFEAASVPMKVNDDRHHALRIAVSAAGALRMWLDGWLVLEKQGAPSLHSLGEGDARNGFPVMRFGEDGNRNVLGGVMDDIAIYDRALSAPAQIAVARDYSRITPPEYRVVPPSNGAEVLVLGADGVAKTGPFKVADSMDAQVFGQMNAAAEKFVRAASSATMSIDKDLIQIVVDCPVPEGMTPSSANDPWSGDRVMVFIRPKSTEPKFFCHCVNSAGRTAGGIFGVKSEGWRSNAKRSVESTANGFRVHVTIPVSEVFGDMPPKPGDIFGINFVRDGRTCGGHSAWSMKGGVFNDAKWTFGTAVFGGAKPYFLRRLAEARRQGEAFASSSAEARKALDDACRSVEAAVEAHADDSAAFASLERMFGELDRTLLTIVQKGRPLLVYTSKEMWGNSPEPTLESRPLELIRLRVPRNTRRTTAFAIANLRDEPFVGNMKFFDRYDGFYSTGGRLPPPKKGVARRFTLRRAITVSDKDGRALFDPVAELPLGSTVEVAPGKTLPIFAELDTHGVAPGRHYALLVLRSATAGFPNTRIAVEVTVTDDDLDLVPTDRFGYTHLAVSFGAGKSPGVSPATNCVRKLVQRGYNAVLLSRINDIYPVCDSNGVWRSPSYKVADRYIDAWLAGGLDPKRIKLVPYLGVEREHDLWWGLRDHTGRRVPFGTPKYDEGLRSLVRFFAEHVQKRYGIERDQIVWYPVDEANGRIDDTTFASSSSRCLHSGRVIRSENASNILMWNPLPGFLRTNDESLHKAMKECVGLFDIIELYRPATTPQIVSLVKSLGARKVWGYHISLRSSAAEGYRRAVWMHLRDGFSETMAYWHLDESGALDASPQHPYATCYIDYDADDMLLSRRQLAADMAAEDGRLVNYLRMKAKDDPAKLAKIEAIVKAAADGTCMADMDEAFERLMDLR